MALESVNKLFGQGGAFLNDALLKIITEIQGLSIGLVVTGAAAATKMNVAALRSEDTIIAALVQDSASGVFEADDKANITISNTKATGTLTVSGNPVNDETFVVNGVTYTFKTTPTDVRHVKIATGDNNAMAANVARAVNSYENRRVGGGFNAPAVKAVASTNVVTFTAEVDGAAGNAITLTESATNVAVSGAGTLTNGTDTGGFVSTTNLTGKGVLLVYFNKK